MKNNVLILFQFILIIVTLFGCTRKQKVSVIDDGSEYISRTFKKGKSSKSSLIAAIPSDVINWADANSLSIEKKKFSYNIINSNGDFLGKIQIVGKQRMVISFPLMGKKRVNPLLDYNLLPITTYKIETNMFKTDHLSRVIRAQIDNVPKSVINRNEIKNSSEQGIAMLKDGIKGKDHGGHLIAHSLGGNSGAINIVAQYGRLNQGKFGAIEKFISKNKSFVKLYTIDVSYTKLSKRPDYFVQQFQFWGKMNELDNLKIRHPELNFVKKTDELNREYFQCVIYHSNIIPDTTPDVSFWFWN